MKAPKGGANDSVRQAAERVREARWRVERRPREWVRKEEERHEMKYLFRAAFGSASAENERAER